MTAHLENAQAPQMCPRCVLDESVPGFRFEKNGTCNYCRMQDELERAFPLGEEGASILKRLADEIRREGRGKAYDCVVGISGGRDTSYCLYYVKEIMGLRPLAVHFDNGWDSDIAKTNLARLCDALDVELHTVIMDWPDSRELTNATIRACVPYIDVTDDVGIASALYRTAAKENLRHIIMSHSFREEGVTPLAWNYMDARYVRAIVRRFAAVPLKTFQNVDIHHMLYWMFFKGIRLVNITNYYDDTGDKVEQLLAEKSKLAAQKDFHHPIVTEIVPLKKFYKAEDYHQEYYDNNPSQGYCQVVIAPKLEKLEQKKVIQPEPQTKK